jgi:maltoporin
MISIRHLEGSPLLFLQELLSSEKKLLAQNIDNGVDSRKYMITVLTGIKRENFISSFIRKYRLGNESANKSETQIDCKMFKKTAKKAAKKKLDTGTGTPDRQPKRAKRLG